MKTNQSDRPQQAEARLRRYAEQLEALRELNLELATQLDLDVLLPAVISRAVELLGGSSGSLYLYQPEQDVLQLAVSIGFEPPPGEVVLRRGEGLSGRVLESGQPMVVDDYQQWAGRAALWKDYPFGAVAGTPVRRGEELLGVVTVAAEPPRAFSPADLELLSLFADQAAIAIRNARLYQAVHQELDARVRTEEALRESEERYRDLVEHSQDLICTHDLEGCLLSVNLTATRVSGYRPDELVNRNLLDFMPPGSEDGFRAYLATIQEHGVASGLLRMLTRAGETRVWEYNNNLRRVSGEATIVRGMARDVTERLRAEKALRKNEKLLREIAANYPNSYLSIVEPDLTIGFTSGQEFKKQGLDPNSLVGMTLEQVFGDHAPVVCEAYLKAFGGVETEFELFFNGQHQLYRVVPLVDGGGKVERILAVVENITERKRADEALRESEGRYRTLFEQAHDGIYLANGDDEILDVNPALCQLMGYTREELLTMRVTDLQAPEVRGEGESVLRNELARHGTSPFEALNIGRDGTRIPVEVRVARVTGLEGERYFSIVRDITDRKRAAEALRMSERRYRSLFEYSPVSLWEEDFSDVKTYLDGLRESGVGDLRAFLETHPEAVARCAAMVKVVDVNRATLEMYRADSVEALSGGLGAVFGPESYDAFRDELVAVGEGKTGLEIEAITRTLTGEKNNIVLRWVVAPGYEETLSKVWVSIIDVTERKQAEEEIRRRAEELAALNRGARQLAESLDVAQVVDNITSACVETFGARLAWLLRAEPDGSMRHVSHSPAHVTYPAQVAIRWDESPLGQGPTGRAVRSGEPVVFADPATTPDYVPWREAALKQGFFTSAAFPLISSDKTFGCLNLYSDQPGFFSPRQVEFFQTFASQAAAALENARLFEAVQTELAQRKQAQEALRESEERFRTILDDIEDGYFEVDIAGSFTFANPALARMLRFPENELIGMNNRQYMTPETAKTVYQVFNRVFRTGIPEQAFDWVLVRKDGKPRSVDASVSPIKAADGSIEGFRGIVRDVTERVQAEVALRESERMLKDAQALAQIGNWVFYPANQQIEWSDQTYRLYERDPALGPPTVEEEAAYYSPEQAQTLREYSRRAIEEGKESAYDLEATLPSGKTVHFTAAMRPILDQDGRIIKLFGTVHDITERVQAEKERRRLHEQLERHAAELERRVAERTAALQQIVNLMAGREIRMGDLKKVIRQLRAQLQQAGLEPVADDALAADYPQD